MQGGNEKNLKLIHQDHDAVKKIAALAEKLGVLVHIDGIPFGADIGDPGSEGITSNASS